MLGLLIDAHIKHDLALLGKFDGIANQIDDDLTQTRRIPDDTRRHIGMHIRDQFKAFFVRTDGQHPNCLEHGVLNGKGQRLEFHLASFDFRKIEDVIDDGQQRLG